MASVILTGKGGDVVWADDTKVQDGVTAWALEATVNVVDVTSIDDNAAGADQGWRKFIAGRIDWTATVDTLNTANDITALSGTAAQLELKDGSAAGVTDMTLANAICTGLAITNDQTDAVRATYEFVCAGAV